MLGILRLQAIHDISSAIPIQNDSLLMFNLCDQLPGGDLILETLANMSNLRELDHEKDFRSANGMYSISVSDMVSNLGFVFGATSPNTSNESRIAVGEITVGEMTPLETVVKESKSNYKKVVSAQATVDGVKVDGIDTNLAVMKVLNTAPTYSKFRIENRASMNYPILTLMLIIFLYFQELLFPLDELRKSLQSLAYWDDPWKSSGFCLLFSFIICR